MGPRKKGTKFEEKREETEAFLGLVGLERDEEKKRERLSRRLFDKRWLRRGSEISRKKGQRGKPIILFLLPAFQSPSHPKISVFLSLEVSVSFLLIFPNWKKLVIDKDNRNNKKTNSSSSIIFMPLSSAMIAP